MISEANILKFVLMSSLFLTGCFPSKPDSQTVSQEIAKHEFRGEIFGSYYYIKYNGTLNRSKFLQELNEFFRHFNSEFSTYQTDSIISAFNQLPAHEKLKVSPRFIEMLKLARKFYQDTEGAFDPTLGPVIKAWGFGGTKKTENPSPKKLALIRKSTGFHHLKWDEKTLVVWKEQAGLMLDLNAFAPGWAADLIGEMLVGRGVNNFMVDISGEILLKGKKKNGSPWVIGIERPAKNYAQGVQLAIKVTDEAVATSGDYRQFYNDQGVRRSHIIDPRTGYPVHHKISSATVMTKTCAEADAWSTAMMVLGERGLKLAEKHNLRVFMLTADRPGTFSETMSPSMKSYIEKNQF
jgi:FAD:protein FMN transferase